MQRYLHLFFASNIMSVVENPDDVTVSKADGQVYNVISPFKYLDQPDLNKTVLLILNQGLAGMNILQLWNNTQLHVCADGGANQLYEYFGENEKARALHIPHFIVGDLDSLTDKTRAYYALHGTIVIPQLTQYATDFDKSLLVSRLYFHSEETRAKLQDYEKIDEHDGLAQLELEVSTPPTEADDIYVYALGGIGGRFDQTIASMHQLYKLSEQYKYIDILFITSSDIVFLVKKGKNYIEYSLKQLWNAQDKVPVCGLLPLGNTPVTLNTSGLKYDVTDWESSMLGNVSSSNGICGVNGVIVESSGPIVMNIVVDHHTVWAPRKSE